MLTLKIAGTVVVFLLGLGFTPTFLDYTAPGRWLRVFYFGTRRNPAFPVMLVLMLAAVTAVILLLRVLYASTDLGEVILAFIVVFIVALMAAVAVTPPPRTLALPPPAKGFIAQFMDEHEA